ncbi:MAG: type II secretion system protein GspG [Candidatus Sumerlaeia bacterium]|nr:type II secretion system protein GspG [Candidatus Sumerlaeia bacterium]
MKAFTLIELLVAVAVIAILAAIAVPNFLAAQTRSKAAAAVADLRTIRTALEAYAVDENTYPLNAGGIGLPGALLNLTRPVAYLTALPVDPFTEAGTNYFYLAAARVSPLSEERYGKFVLASVGPDRKLDTTLSSALRYDPTNGTVSDGDILYTHRDGTEAASR